MIGPAPCAGASRHASTRRSGGGLAASSQAAVDGYRCVGWCDESRTTAIIKKLPGGQGEGAGNDKGALVLTARCSVEDVYLISVMILSSGLAKPRRFEAFSGRGARRYVTPSGPHFFPQILWISRWVNCSSVLMCEL